jgi:hypothetical protein
LTEALSSTARALEDEAEAAIEGRQIFGPAALSPDYARQLALSSEGATHVATLPLGELATLLDRLFADADLSAELSAGMGEAAANGWAEGLRAARQAIAEAQRTYGERVLIAMPMAIDAPAGEGG